MNNLAQPILDPKSECFECTAGMCGYQTCRGDQYFYGLNNHEPFHAESNTTEKAEVDKIEILKCYMCGWTHSNPNEWNHYERATNGTLQKSCGGCGRISLILQAA